MTKRRRILHADKVVQSVFHIFYLIMFLQLKGYYSIQSNPMLLYSTTSDIRVANISKPGKITVIIKSLEQGSAVDFLYRKNLICWSDQTAELIQCMYYNGTHVGDKLQIVSEGVISPIGIAIDWFTDKIYWTDGETNRIEVISIEQKYRKVLFWVEVDLARAIAVVPMEGLMFWTDWGEVPKIERAGMNGDPKTRKVIVKDDIFWPNGITVDYTANVLYWVDAKLQFVDAIDLDGNNRRRVVKTGLVYPYALTMFSEKLYWTDWKKWSIHMWDMSTNGPIKELIKSDPAPVDIRAYDPSRQCTPTITYPCQDNNGGCSHLCLLSPDPPGHTCACPTGVKLIESSNTTCHNGPQSLLLVAHRSGISKISLDSPDFTPYALPLKDVKRAIAVDFDPKTEHIYWADNVSKMISRARLDGSEQMTLIRDGDLGVPDSIAVDCLARNIYWTDPELDTITVARLDGSYKKVIIHDELYDPRAIALHPTAGWMFWSDWNEKKPKIERANLDGTDRVLLISEKLAWPNGIALDTVNNKVYWGDARTHKIEVCDMDGSGRRELHNMDILHIFGLTLLDNYLYWTDMQRRSLERIDKISGEERQPVVEQMANMMGVKAVHLRDHLGWNPCVDSNGNCSHLCFNRPKDYVCSCPLGLELSTDHRTCIEPEAFLIYSRKGTIGRISIENENNDAVLPLKELKEVNALSVHVSGSKLYWSDTKTKTINRCSINGANMEKILEWTGLVEGLAIDWPGQNIFWTDANAQRIEVARLDGSSRRTLIWQGLKKPKSIVLDPRKGYMYWSELGSKTIKRAQMDGANPIVLFEQVGKVNSLAIDYEKRNIYWAALEPPVIEYAHLDGSERRKILSEDIPMPYALTLYMDRLFWGDWSTGDVESVKKIDGTDRRTVHRKLDYISDLKVYHKYRHAGANQCAVDNGGCSHLCLATASNVASADYRCACATHYRLDRDNLTCLEPEEFILYAQKSMVGRIMTTSGECSDAVLSITGLKNVKAIEYDPVNKQLYWMDEDSHAIRHVPVSSSTTSAMTDSRTLVTGLSRPFHMVLDVLGRALYWSCMDTDSINATSIEGNSSVGVIVRGEKMMPRHLVFHQTKRYLVWNDVGLGCIMRANADGTARTQLAQANNATALALDQATGVVYWAMARQIHAVDIDGSNRRTVWQGGWVGALGAVGGSLYWGGGERAPMRLTLARRDAPAAPLPHVARLTAIVTVHKVDREHACFGGSSCGGGPGACLADGACGCGLDCASTPPHCPAEHFPCGAHKHSPDGHTPCIPNTWKCDGQADCADGSDEVAAECDECARGVRCFDGSCADSLGGCATGALCLQVPLPDAFRCDDRLCIAARYLCDGTAHCADGSDEAPTACDYAQKDEVVPGSRASNAWVTVGAIVGAAVVLAGTWTLVRRWRGGVRRARSRPADLTAAVRLNPTKPPPERARPLGASCTDSVIVSSNDVNSGSDSVYEHYPRPTLNPPPSPATASASTVLAWGRRRAYRHYRAMNRPPPPTPCSTDACESDCTPRPPSAPPPSPDPHHDDLYRCSNLLKTDTLLPSDYTSGRTWATAGDSDKKCPTLNVSNERGHLEKTRNYW